MNPPFVLNCTHRQSLSQFMRLRINFLVVRSYAASRNLSDVGASARPREWQPAITSIPPIDNTDICHIKLSGDIWRWYVYCSASRPTVIRVSDRMGLIHECCLHFSLRAPAQTTGRLGLVGHFPGGRRPASMGQRSVDLSIHHAWH